MKNDALMNNENVLAGDETVTEDTSEKEVSFLYSSQHETDNQNHVEGTLSLNSDADGQENITAEVTNNTINETRESDTNPLTEKATKVIPSPFKRAMYWPDKQKKKGNEPKKRKREVPSPVITSEAWREHVENKERKKKELQAQKKASAPKRKQRKIKKKSEIFSSENESSWKPSGRSIDDFDLSFGEGEDNDDLFQAAGSSVPYERLATFEAATNLGANPATTDITAGRDTDSQCITDSPARLESGDSNRASHSKHGDSTENEPVLEQQEGEKECVLDENREEQPLHNGEELDKTLQESVGKKMNSIKKVRGEEPPAPTCSEIEGSAPVSYTHLDVYKRQELDSVVKDEVNLATLKLPKYLKSVTGCI